MRLDFKKKFSAEKTIVLLSLVEISAWEKAAIKAVGAPNIVLKKTYPRTQTKVDINSALDLFINIRVDFLFYVYKTIISSSVFCISIFTR